MDWAKPNFNFQEYRQELDPEVFSVKYLHVNLLTIVLMPPATEDNNVLTEFGWTLATRQFNASFGLYVNALFHL